MFLEGIVLLISHSHDNNTEPAKLPDSWLSKNVCCHWTICLSLQNLKMSMMLSTWPQPQVVKPQTCSAHQSILYTTPSLACKSPTVQTWGYELHSFAVITLLSKNTLFWCCWKVLLILTEFTLFNVESWLCFLTWWVILYKHNPILLNCDLGTGWWAEGSVLTWTYPLLLTGLMCSTVDIIFWGSTCDSWQKKQHTVNIKLYKLW